MEQFYLALDIGGTKTTGALFTRGGEILDDYVYTAQSQTYKGEEAVYQNTRAVLQRVIDYHGISMDQVLGIGVGSPGPLDTKRGIIVHAPLMRWRNFPIVERLKQDFRVPVRLDNDGNLGVLAEQRCGVAQGLDHVLYMTVSTGCGGGVMIHGKVFRGAHDGAGEVGHMSIDFQGLSCPCGSKGCFELYASGTALNEIMKKDMVSGVKSRVFELANGDPEQINGKLLTQAAQEGDTYALALYKQEGQYLGMGISNLCNLFDPQAIVLGGGVTKAKAFFHEFLFQTLKERCLHPIDKDTVRYSEMNDRVVLYGAYHLISEEFHT